MDRNKFRIDNIKNEKFKFYNKENSDLPDNHVWSIKIDSENVWVGTKKGLVQITDTDGNI